MQRCGIIEVGTRGIRLVVAQHSKKNPRGFEVLRTRGGLVNLGEKLTPENKAMTEDRMRAAADMIEDFFREAADFQPDHIVVLATEVLRRASNVDEFLEKIPGGLPTYILTPRQEAALSFRAAADSFRGHNIRGGEFHDGPMLLIDLGGGSAEIVAGSFGTAVGHSNVADTLHLPALGSVGMQEVFDTTDGDIATRARAVAQHVETTWRTQPPLTFGSIRSGAVVDDDDGDAVDGAEVLEAEDEGGGTAVGLKVNVAALGSAATELAWRLRGASPQSFRSRDVHGQRVGLQAARDYGAKLLDKLKDKDPENLADEDRKDVGLLFGTYVFDEILSAFDAEHFRVCGYGLRFGAAAYLLEGGTFPPLQESELNGKG